MQLLRRVPYCLLAIVFCWNTVGSAYSEDWPQWLGVQRDGVWREDGIIDSFPEGGPKVLWRTKLGGGYSGPSIANGRVFVMDRIADEIEARAEAITFQPSCISRRAQCAPMPLEHPVISTTF